MYCIKCNDNQINSNNDYFDYIERRKGISLCPYARLFKQWINHIRLFLNVFNELENIFSNFIIYFKS